MLGISSMLLMVVFNKNQTQFCQSEEDHQLDGASWFAMAWDVKDAAVERALPPKESSLGSMCIYYFYHIYIFIYDMWEFYMVYYMCQRTLVFCKLPTVPSPSSIAWSFQPWGLSPPNDQLKEAVLRMIILVKQHTCWYHQTIKTDKNENLITLEPYI